jgi:hypothetical protein
MKRSLMMKFMHLDETKECLDEMQFSCDNMYGIYIPRVFINFFPVFIWKEIKNDGNIYRYR